MSVLLCLTNPSGLVPDAEVQACAKALTVQVNRDFNPAWNGAFFVAWAGVPTADSWVLSLDPASKAPQGALGYHIVTPDGHPWLHVFPELDAQDGVPWTTTASHEALEALLDPWLRMAFLCPDGSMIAGEVCDGVEQDSYDVGGVPVSNFALPAYFSPPPNHNGPFDFMKLCTKPFETRPGGYNQFYKYGQGWHMVSDAKMRAYRAMGGARRR